VHFVAVVEPGDLERKCVLLLESIRRFGGSMARFPVWFVQPRKGGRLSDRTQRVFFDLDARLLIADLNREWHHYPIANKILASAFVESLLPADETVLCFLDSDIACLGEPTDLLLDGRFDTALRPVDQVGVGQRVNASLSDYWKRVFRLCNVDPDAAWPVRTSVELTEVLVYFNAGVIASRCRLGLFRLWADALERSKHAGPFLGNQLHNLDQALLAGIIVKHVPRTRIGILSSPYNYPLHLQDQLPESCAVRSSGEIALAHYHELFYRRDCLERLPLTPGHREWLDARLPIETRWQRQVRRIRRHLDKSPELRATPT
jgi:hypothetical protein